MSLLDAPTYDPRRDIRNRNLLIGGSVLLALLLILTLAGFVMGHGWLFTNLSAEHRADRFFTALEAKDYAKAYGLYNNDDGHEHSEYSLKRFTEDWTTYSPVKGPITSHHVDVSRADGKGLLGGTVIVAVRVNGGTKVFIDYLRGDGTLTCCSVTKEIQY